MSELAAIQWFALP